MRPHRQLQPRRRLTRGFTLVELVTAAALMSVIMVGVVQIFDWITSTTAEAEGLSFAHQQLRAAFDTLNGDFRGLSRQGYLKFDGYVSQGQGGGAYRTNSLGLVSVGDFQGRPYGALTQRAAAAEVLYTTRVLTPVNFLQVQAGNQTVEVDHRRGVLGRGCWLMSGATSSISGGGNPGSDTSFVSAAPYPAMLSTTNDRWDRPGGGAHLMITPWTEDQGMPSQHAETLNRALACCASQIYVDYFMETPDLSTGGYGSNMSWQVPAQGGAKSFVADDGRWPRAVRVTVAVHDPDDRGGGSQPYKGYVLQEIFWIGDP